MSDGTNWRFYVSISVSAPRTHNPIMQNYEKEKGYKAQFSNGSSLLLLKLLVDILSELIS
jgi:hypothetical protein